eukprot:8053411-Lingulodinium_polyedra.AAC.1
MGCARPHRALLRAVADRLAAPHRVLGPGYRAGGLGRLRDDRAPGGAARGGACFDLAYCGRAP